MTDITTELVLGAQQTAARQIADTAPTLQQAVSTLVQGVEAEQHGFQGSAASAFYSALRAWLTLGRTIPTAAMAYAGKLVEVDRTVAESQAAQGTAYERVAGSLSAWSIE
jgi:uncharacterized protein YukE